MKKILLSLFIVSTLFISCSSDDDSTNTAANCTGSIDHAKIVGTWNYTSLRTDGVTETTINGTTTTTNQIVNFVSSTVTFTFNADGTFVSSGQTIVEDIVNGVNVGRRALYPADSGDYSIDANNMFAFSNLASQSDPDIARFTVQRLGDTNFCMTAVINEVIGDGTGSYSSVSTGTSSLGFTKQ